MGLKSFHLLHLGMNMGAPDSPQLGSIEQFCKAAELGSFTAAAEFFGVTPAAVSRSISRLEKRLGVRLFSRTTRSIKVTNEGELYWKECQLALEQIAEAERAITGAQTVPSGLLRISVSAAYGTYRLLPLMPKFTEAYPQIEIELSISDKIIDFVEEGYDWAFSATQDWLPTNSRMFFWAYSEHRNTSRKRVLRVLSMTLRRMIVFSTYHRIQGAR
jgi:DNA-binding transcriptional LysR family regulator